MNIPQTVKVGGHTYKILQNHKFKEIVNCYGQTDHTALEIRLCENGDGGKIARSKIENNFIHEIMHTVDNTYNNAALKEEDVVRLSEGLYQVLNDNGILK